MKLIFSDRFSVDTSGVLITKGATPGSGVIPDTIDVKQVTVIPDGSDDYYVKGIDTNSDWAKVEGGVAFELKGLGTSWEMFYVKAASSSITLNLFVKGM